MDDREINELKNTAIHNKKNTPPKKYLQQYMGVYLFRFFGM